MPHPYLVETVLAFAMCRGISLDISGKACSMVELRRGIVVEDGSGLEGSICAVVLKACMCVCCDAADVPAMLSEQMFSEECNLLLI